MDQHYLQDNNAYALNSSVNTSPPLKLSSDDTLFPNTDFNQSFPHRLFTNSQEAHAVSDSTFSPFWISNILEAISIQDDSIPKQALNCPCSEGFVAKFFCHDCKENLCEKCFSAHNRVNLTKMHNVVKIETNCERSSIDDFHKNCVPLSNHVTPFSDEGVSKTCKFHMNEALNLFCETCLQAICSQCTINGVHKEHRYHLLKGNNFVHYPMMSVAKNNLQRIENTVQEVQKTVERVVSKSRDVQSEIHAAVHKHIMALKQREVELINKVDQIKMFKCKVLSDQLDHLNGLSNKLKMSMSGVNEAVSSGDEVLILKAKQKFENDISTCQDTGYVAEDDGIVFVQPNDSVMRVLASFGNVRSSVCAQQSVLYKDNGTPGTAFCAASVMFSIHSRDHSGAMLHTKPEAFDVTVKQPDDSTSPISIFDSGAGRFVFQLNPVLEGDYIISVQSRGVPIQESPYLLKVKHNVTYKSRSLSGAPALIFGKEGDKPGELCRPWGICCSAKGFIVVADRSNNRIQVFNSDGTFHHMFGSSGTRHGQFDRPAGVAVDSQDRIIVVDKDNHRVQIFQFDGSFFLAFGEKGSKHGQFNYPWDVDVNKSGVMAVTDTRNHRIQLFTFDGKFISKYGFDGAMWKHFDSPRGVAFTHDDRLIVTDFNNHRLVIINPDMKSARYLGSEGSQTSQFLRPQGVAVDEEGNMIVADSRNHRLQVFTSSGGLIAVFGGARMDDKCDPIQMDRPSGVAVTPDGHIAVVDFGNNRVILF